MLDLYLSPEYHEDWMEIVRLSRLNDEDSHSKLTRYVMEACRLCSAAPGVARTVTKNTTITNGDKQVICKPGDTVFVDLVALISLLMP